MSKDFSLATDSWRALHARRLLLFLSYLCSSAFICGQCFAQPRNSLFGKDSLQGVYVRDSAIAVEKIALAERLERLKEWSKAAEIYQEIIEQYADRVVPSRVDDSNQIVQYTSVVSAVQERLAKWPADGLSAYRNRYEAAAAQLLNELTPDGSTDLQLLHRVANLYFVTDTAKAAARQLIDLQLQNGEFAAAAWLGDRLLQWHPNVDAERPEILYRTAIAYRLLGNRAAADGRLNELATKYADATGVIRGEMVKLADSLKIELAGEIAIQTAAADSWPTAFGNASRDRVPTSTATSGARLFSVPITRTFPRVPGANRQQSDLDKTDREAGYATGIHPVIDRGEMFFQDNARVYGLSIDSGLPLPGWAETYGGDRGGRYELTGAWPTPLGAQLAVTVTDDAVFAIVGQNDLRAMLYAGNAGGPRESRLVCLDRRSGTERWSFAAGALNKIEDKAAARGMVLVGTPVVAGDRVYVTAQSAAGVQFQKCEVVAIDQLTGQLAWRSDVASASTNAQPWDVETSTLDESTPQLSFADGRLYACTNLGATAALDAYDGTVVWLNLYPRDLPDQGRLMQFQRGLNSRGGAGRRPRPWSHNPVIVTGNHVFTLPRNSDFVFINDASTGAELSRISVKPFDSADTLVGVIDEKLVIGGLKKITCLDWKKFKPDAAIDAYRLWSKEFSKAGFEDASIRGRSFLTSDSVFVPTAWRLSRVSLKSGAAISGYPPDGREWGDEESSGNLLVLQDHLIIAGPEQVAVYTDLNLAMRKLDREVATEPSSPQPRLRYAEVMFVAGRHDLATAKLDEAMTLLGGAAALQPGASRDRLFNSSLNFARKLMTAAAPPADIINGFFDRAAQAADAPQQQVAYRIARGRWLKNQKDDAGELAFYQQILADPAMRQESVSSGMDGGAAIPAAYFAERTIAELIARNPSAYAPIEARARAEYETIANGADPEKLLAVAQTFPNAQIAAAALFSAAGIYESRTEHRQAVTILRALLPRNLSRNDRLLCVESLARNYLLLPNRLEVASSRLAQAAQLAPAGKLARLLTLPDGRTLEGITFADAASAVKQLRRDRSRQSLPVIKLPPGDGPPEKTPPAFIAAGAPIDGVVKLLRPPADVLRLDRLVAFKPDAGVCVFDATNVSARPLFSSATAVNEPPVGCTWVGQSLLYWTPARVVFVKGDDSGESMWETSLIQVPPVDVTAAGADELAESNQDLADQVENQQAGAFNPRQRQVILNGGGRMVIRQGGRVIMRNGNGLRGVRGIQVRANEAIEVGREPGGDERIIHARALSDRVIVATNQGRILAIDLADGNCLWQVRPSDRSIDRLLANDDFVATMFFDDNSAQIVAIDASTGQFVLRRVFPKELGPVNFCLAPDGKLIWLLPEALFAKDLFDPSDRPTYSRTIRPPDGGQVFGIETRLLDQMAVVDDRILVLSDNGQFVRAFSLDDGLPVTHQSTEGNMTIERRYRTGSSDWNVKLFISGSRLYAMGVNTGTLLSHDLEKPDSSITLQVRNPDSTTRWAGREVIATTTHVLKLEEPTNVMANRRRNNTNAPGEGLRIVAFRRSINEAGRENGRLDHLFGAPGQVVSEEWQPVEGGIAYLTVDRKLHILRGGG